MADDLERLLASDRRPHHLLDIFGVTNLQDIHANCPVSSEPPVLKMWLADTSAAEQTPAPSLGRLLPLLHLIRLAPGPGTIFRSRIDSDFDLGSLVRTTFTGRPDPRSVTFAAGPSGGGIHRSPHCESA